MKKALYILMCLVMGAAALAALAGTGCSPPAFDPISPLVLVGAHDIAFVSHTSNGTHSTWTYQVTSGTQPSLSHWVISWCGLGIKFDGGYEDGETRTVSFTLRGDYPEGPVRVCTKAGVVEDCGWVTGPLCEPVAIYTITATAGAGGAIAPSGAVVVNEGDSQTFTITASVGYAISGVLVDGASVGAVSSYTFSNVTDDHAIHAAFEAIPPVTYNLTISSTAGGTVTTPSEGTQTYEAGTVVALEAAADEGYRFVKWVGGPIDGVTDPETSITMEGDYSITAIFAEEEISITPITPAYVLRVSSTEGGSATSPGEGMFSYPEGRVVRLVARADDGYKFTGWSGDVGTIADVNAAATAVTMQWHYSITATFEPETSPPQYNLTISSTPGGSVTIPGEGTFTYDAGAVVNLVAESEEGYRFVNWTGDVDTIALGNAASTTITMQGDYQINASFEDGVWGPGVSVMGVTKEVDSAILPEAAVILYQNGEAVANAISDEHGIYALMISVPGDYDVVASKEGFTDEVQFMSITEPKTGAPDFLGDHGLIPAAPSTSYVLSCISLWKFGEWPFQLSTSKVLEVISAWVYR